MPDYKNSKIYRITAGDLTYIGSTTEPTLARRLAGHVGNYKRWKDGKHHNMTSFLLIETGQYEITLIELYPCGSKDELTARERYWIENTVCVNKVIPGRTPKEYYEANTETICEQSKAYYQANVGTIREKKKTYREANANAIREKMKTYREANANAIREQSKAYYQENANAIREKKKTYREANANAIREKKKTYREANANAICEKKKAHYQANKDELKRRREAKKKSEAIP